MKIDGVPSDAFLLPDRKRVAAFVAVYSVVRFLADVAATKYAAGTGFSPWFLGTAFDIVLFLVLGWKWWPLPVALMALHVVLVPQGLRANVFVNLSEAVAYELIFALAVKMTVERFKVSFPLRSLRDVSLFAAILCFGTPIVAGLVASAIYIFSHTYELADFARQYSRLIAAESSAIIVVVPAVMQLFAWRDKSKREPEEPSERANSDFMFGLAATFLVVVLEYAIGTHYGRPVIELSFVPLAWLAVRHGMRGAVLGILIADLTATLMHLLLAVPLDSQVEYQGYLVASALMALLLGAATQDRNAILARLERRAYVDELTNLPNRDRLVSWIRRHRDQSLVLVMLDIDDMRLLNEGVGRLAADRVLQEFASRLRTSLPPSFFVARVSSDEFGVAIVDDRSPHAVIAEIRQLLEVPFDIDGSRIFIEASAGAVRMVRAGDVDDLLRRADLALHRAKSSPSRAVVYTPDLQGGGAPLLVVELHRALEQNEFVPFFQPIYRFDHKMGVWRLAGAEALLRWIHPQRGVVTPIDFIDMLERLSIGVRVGWDVMEKSLLLANRWRTTVPDFRVWVNLFARQALDPKCVARIQETIELAQSVPQALAVEINERIVVSEERDIISLVSGLRELGVMTAIDDFGTGGSSLGRVRDVPAQVLKIDRSFVTRCEVDAKARAVAAAVVRLGTELGMDVVAEGVENSLQIEAMIDIGCEYAQGYALGHPVPADLFERMVVESVAS
jgi:diguanylate cyclase (GGDEF)-like protein